MFKTKPRIEFRQQISLVLLVGITILLLNTCHKGNMGFSVHKKALQQELLDIPVWKPKNVFADNSFFFAGNRFVINLQDNQGVFRWQVPENCKGYLSFRAHVFLPEETKGQNDDKNLILPLTEITVIRKNASQERTILTNNMTDLNFRDRLAFSKGFQKEITVNRGDTLEFRVNPSLESLDNREIMYGITVPRLENPSLLAEQAYKNLIIISIDTLRADYVGIYKQLAGEKVDFSFSPNLDAFADQSVVFLNASTPETATWPALASLLVSRYPFDHGVLYNGEFLRANFDSIATHMLDLGYQTLSLHGNAYRLNIAGIEEKYNFFNNDFGLIDAAIKRLKQNKERPFFHWYHFMGVHADYKPPLWVHHILNNQEDMTDEELTKRYDLFKIMQGEEEMTDELLQHIKSSYAGELYHLDFELKRIFDYLKQHKLWDESFIIILSDHGEDLYEHNNYFFHYPSLYNASTRVPLMIKFPGQKNQIVIPEQVSLLDIYPTVAEYYATTVNSQEPQQDFSGISLLELLSGNTKPFQNRVLFAGIEKFEILAAIHKNWKLIYNPDNIIPITNAQTPYPLEEIELYDISADPSESDNIAGKHYALAKELIEDIIAFRKEHVLGKKETDKEGQIQIDEKQKKEALEALKALGYIK
jgi:arylsulfatase A-like enzyme